MEELVQPADGVGVYVILAAGQDVDQPKGLNGLEKSPSGMLRHTSPGGLASVLSYPELLLDHIRTRH
jgi:hypothetical protein